MAAGEEGEIADWIFEVHPYGECFPCRYGEEAITWFQALVLATQSRWKTSPVSPVTLFEFASERRFFLLPNKEDKARFYITIPFAASNVRDVDVVPSEDRRVFSAVSNETGEVIVSARRRRDEDET